LRALYNRAAMPTRHTVQQLFGTPRALVGVVHVGALPGAPLSVDPLDAIVDRAVREAHVYEDAGFSGVILENMHDRPYRAGVAGPEVVAAMTAVGREVRREIRCPIGIQILAAANRESLAVAFACGAAFVRVEGFVFAHVADEGVIASDAAELQRYRRTIGATGIQIWADVKKKHAAHAITADVAIADTAQAAEFFLADAVIVTGPATGREADVADLEAVRAAVSVPVVVGSGVTRGNLRNYVAADAFIVGSAAKTNGEWWQEVDRDRVDALVLAFRALVR
jgi:membrane complex biogenesis BtpA family protein